MFEISAGKTRGKIALPREFEWRSNADRHIRISCGVQIMIYRAD